MHELDAYVNFMNYGIHGCAFTATGYYNIVIGMSTLLFIFLQLQNEKLWKVRDQLQSSVSLAELKDMLEANGQKVPSGESNVSGGGGRLGGGGVGLVSLSHHSDSRKLCR